MNNKYKTMTALAVLILTGALAPGHPSHAMDQLDAPETVTIDALSNLYQPVEFSHKHHIKLARCQDCHHHTTGHKDMDPNCIRCHAQSTQKPIVSCVDCHIKKQFYPKQVIAADNPQIYHIDKPGLKGAYHLNCIPCHVKKNAPSGCEGCHAMTDKGKKFFDINLKNSSDSGKEKHAH